MYTQRGYENLTEKVIIYTRIRDVWVVLHNGTLSKVESVHVDMSETHRKMTLLHLPIILLNWPFQNPSVVNILHYSHLLLSSKSEENHHSVLEKHNLGNFILLPLRLAFLLAICLDVIFFWCG